MTELKHRCLLSVHGYVHATVIEPWE